MHELTVQHSSGSYPVISGAGLLHELSDLLEEFMGARALVVTDEHVAPRWLPLVQAAFPDAQTLVLPAGERYKRLETVARIWDAAAECSLGRDGVMVALGGGVIGDMTGFAAACWMRGIRYLQLPTTLLAQVDASVGGKTAVDHASGKNLVGAFHSPAAVIADVESLATLPSREFNCGMAEAIKTALIDGVEFVEWLERHAEGLVARDAQVTAALVHRCCAVKARIVSADEKEGGIRAVLNLGHTFGHAIEKLTAYTLPHGEAVAIGLVLALRLSETLLDAGSAPRERVVGLLERFSLPTALPPGLEPGRMLEAMRLDKKHYAGAWRFILLRAPGVPVIQEIRESAAVETVLREARAR